MFDREPDQRTADRLDRVVGDVLSGRRLRLTPADASEQSAILIAGRLAGARPPEPQMSPRFRRRLTALLNQRQAEGLSRRKALAAGLALSGGLAGGAVAELARGLVLPRSTLAPSTSMSGPILIPQAPYARWIDTGLEAALLADDTPYLVRAGAIDLFVVRRKGELTALSAHCTHQPCTLSWQAGSGKLQCPCHSQAFDLGGLPLSSAYSIPPLPRIETRITKGRVEVLSAIG